MFIIVKVILVVIVHIILGVQVLGFRVGFGG